MSQLAIRVAVGLLLIFNFYWILTYFLVIRRGFIERTWGIPMISLTLNIAWDITGAFSTAMRSPAFQKIGNMVFVIANLIITYQMFRYWRSDFNNLSAKEFFFFWAIAQVMSLRIIYIGSIELNDPIIFKMGFVDNLINSALFIAMFYRRPDLLGQSIYIGLSKLIGTGAVSLSSLIAPPPGTEDSLLMPFLFQSILVLDVIYVFLVYKRGQQMGIDIWRRW